MIEIEISQMIITDMALLITGAIGIAVSIYCILDGQRNKDSILIPMLILIFVIVIISLSLLTANGIIIWNMVK